MVETLLLVVTPDSTARPHVMTQEWPKSPTTIHRPAQDPTKLEAHIEDSPATGESFIQKLI
jgi:hypothetical protein